ncbi:hypothetical protein NDU88_006774 [Pleurodeles waltl]|uniref:Uncharacterized protein n=1 Tax=Pleurodeles waltl TaxID=8319 RepID=A0AAV7WBL4_PLEWA|nr:hypothetical protein NDU88_006774 [Pleurodeles waltl]
MLTLSGGPEEGEQRTDAKHKEMEEEQTKVDGNSVRQRVEKGKRHVGLGEQEEETDMWFDADGEMPPETLLHLATAQEG